MFLCEALERVYSGQSDGKHFVAEHLSALLIALVQQSSLSGGSLSFSHPASPHSEYRRDHSAYYQGDGAYRGSERVLTTAQIFPIDP